MVSLPACTLDTQTRNMQTTWRFKERDFEVDRSGTHGCTGLALALEGYSIDVTLLYFDHLSIYGSLLIDLALGLSWLVAFECGFCIRSNGMALPSGSLDLGMDGMRVRVLVLVPMPFHGICLR